VTSSQKRFLSFPVIGAMAISRVRGVYRRQVVVVVVVVYGGEEDVGGNKGAQQVRAWDQINANMLRERASRFARDLFWLRFWLRKYISVTAVRATYEFLFL
jgi:hypothetical protein